MVTRLANMMIVRIQHHGALLVVVVIATLTATLLLHVEIHNVFEKILWYVFDPFKLVCSFLGIV